MITFLGAVPALLYSLFAGSLSDDFGRKPLMIVPIIGAVVTDAALLLNYLFIESVPLQLFYVEHLWQLFGGISIMYMGVYGYIASYTEPEERSYRLVRNDGIEHVGKILATFCSPIVFNQLDYLGTYVIRLCFSVVALLYLIFFVKENFERKSDSTISFHRYFVRPLKDMSATLFKARPNNIRALIWLQFLIYALYWMFIDESLTYLYLLETFEGFDHTKLSHYVLYDNILNTFVGAFIFTPLASNYFKLNDTTLQLIITAIESLGYFLTPLASTLWQLYLFRSLNALMLCKWPIVRSLLSKITEPDELGKILTGIAVVTGAVPFIKTPAFTELYKATLGVFPGSIFVLSGACLLIAFDLNAIFYMQRKILFPTKTDDSETTVVAKNMQEIEGKW